MIELAECSRYEELLVRNFRRGESTDLGGPDAFAAADGESWGDRCVRAQVLSALALGATTVEAGTVPGVRLSGARVTGELDLTDAVVGMPLVLSNCWFDEGITLTDARTRAIRLTGSRVPSLDARGAVVDGPLELIRIRSADIYLGDAQIKGTLDLCGSELSNPEGSAFRAGSMVVEADLLCSAVEHDGRVEPFRSVGQINLIGATIKCSAYFDGAQLEIAPWADGSPRIALVAENLTIGQNLFLQAFADSAGSELLATEVRGELSLRGLRVGGEILLAGAGLHAPGGVALDASAMEIGGRLVGGPAFGLIRCDPERRQRVESWDLPQPLCEPGREDDCSGHRVAVPLRVNGGLGLVDAHIRGSVVLRGARLHNPNGVTLSADRARVEQDLVCSAATGLDDSTLYFRSSGQLNFDGVNVGGIVDFGGAILENSDGITVNAPRLTVGQGISTVMTLAPIPGDDPAEASTMVSRGRIVLTHANVHGDVALDGAIINGSMVWEECIAVDAHRLTVQGDLTFQAREAEGVRLPARAIGGLSLVDAEIGGSLLLHGAELSNPDGLTVNLERATITGTLSCLRGQGGVRFSSIGTFWLADTTVNGRVEFDGAELRRPGHVAMFATNLTAGSSVSCGPLDGVPFEATGDLTFTGASVRGSLLLEGAVIRSAGLAFDGTGLTVGAEMSMASRRADGDHPALRTRSVGQIVLAGADIARSLDFSGAELSLTDDPAAEALPASGPDGELLAAWDGGRAEDADREPLTGLRADGHTLSLDDARIGGDLLLSVVDNASGLVPFRSVGAVSMFNAEVLGNVALTGAELVNPKGNALEAAFLTVGRDLIMSTAWADWTEPLAFRAAGSVMLVEARIGGTLEAFGAVLNTPWGRSLDAENIKVSGDAIFAPFVLEIVGDSDGAVQQVFRWPVSSQGQMMFDGAAIGGKFDLGGAVLENLDGLVGGFSGDRMRVEHSLLAEGIECRATTGPREASFSMAGAIVNGSVCLDGSTLENTIRADSPRDVPGMVATAFDGSGMKVGGDVSFRATGQRPLSASGQVLLARAAVGGTVDLRGAHFAASRRDDGNRTAAVPGWGTTVDLSNATVTGDVLCTPFDDRPFHSAGRMLMVDARVSATVDLTGAQLAALPAPGRASVVLDAGGLHARCLRLRLNCEGPGQVNLAGAHAATLEYPKEQHQTAMRLDGFVYGELTPILPALDRVGWLAGAADSGDAQPHEQLASAYRAAGHPGWARKVMVVRYRRHWLRQWSSRNPLVWVQQLGRGVYDLLIGYGYAPYRAMSWLLAAMVAGWWYFDRFPPQPAGEQRPEYRAWLYALDSVLPASPFNTQDMWRPVGTGFWVSLALQVIGWALALAVLPTITRSLSRDSSGPP